MHHVTVVLTQIIHSMVNITQPEHTDVSVYIQAPLSLTFGMIKTLDQSKDQLTPWMRPTSKSPARSTNAAGEKSRSNSAHPAQRSVTCTVTDLPSTEEK